nr:ATP-dependent helicase [uncultured Hyphomonas sp.]
MSDLYLREAESLRPNEGQWAAYESKGHCVVLAGPGSGKTKTLTIKLARILAEDIEEPRGIACITYNNECARELEQRLDALGVESGGRVFIGTVHSFSLTQIIMPYAKSARMGVPEDFKVATRDDQKAALERAYDQVIARGEDPHRFWQLRMDRYRRTHLDRASEEFLGTDRDTANLIEAYERELRARGLIDFDDMPLLSVRALQANPWLQKAIQAKFPVLIVDEYQDLGRALHRMVMGLCFGTGIRLFAVGDEDQSIYGFTGANPRLLRTLAQREDVKTIRLRLNYRCGSNIIAASQYALGEERDYAAPEGASEGTVYFHSLGGRYEAQAKELFEQLLPKVFARHPDLNMSDVAILYPAAWIGDAVAEAAEDMGYSIVRADTNALYPRSSKLLRWLEQCARWCCGGWQDSDPKFSAVSAEGMRIFAEVLTTEDKRLQFQRDLISFLWTRRDAGLSLHSWLLDFRRDLLLDLIRGTRTLNDENLNLTELIRNTDEGTPHVDLSVGVFCGKGEAHDRINLSTLHSSKGREFKVVFMFGMDQQKIPRRNAQGRELLEARRLFYVGFTRAEEEIHVVSTRGQKSPFVIELEERLQAP